MFTKSSAGRACDLLRAHDYIIAGIHLAKAKVFAN